MRSEGLGHGAEFSLNLPVLPASNAGTGGDVSESVTLNKRLVLVADDNRDIAETMAELLRMEGHEVHLAFDGIEAFERYLQLKPEVMVLDIGMPGQRGDEVARMVRAHPTGASVRLIAITGWGQPSDREQALASGFDIHMTKPVDLRRLIAIVGG